MKMAFALNLEEMTCYNLCFQENYSVEFFSILITAGTNDNQDIDGLMQEINSSVLAMELHLCRIKPLILLYRVKVRCHYNMAHFFLKCSQ